MNIAQMMKQAQQMQQRLKDVQSELDSTEITAQAGNGAVTVVYDGHGKFKSIKILPEAINPENPDSVDADTIETLEDIISTAINNASDKASKEMETKMKSVTGGINIPGLNF